MPNPDDKKRKASSLEEDSQMQLKENIQFYTDLADVALLELENASSTITKILRKNMTSKINSRMFNESEYWAVIARSNGRSPDSIVDEQSNNLKGNFLDKEGKSNITQEEHDFIDRFVGLQWKISHFSSKGFKEGEVLFSKKRLDHRHIIHSSNTDIDDIEYLANHDNVFFNLEIDKVPKLKSRFGKIKNSYKAQEVEDKIHGSLLLTRDALDDGSARLMDKNKDYSDSLSKLELSHFLSLQTTDNLSLDAIKVNGLDSVKTTLALYMLNIIRESKGQKVVPAGSESNDSSYFEWTSEHATVKTANPKEDLYEKTLETTSPKDFSALMRACNLNPQLMVPAVFVSRNGTIEDLSGKSR